ncbi:hypothetical protein, partial [Paracoccus jeotgali]|uniref:hypothetical protein n=1 Tax=Paracoccus jeotgali TaxID=2065379 RepID=UPI0028B1BE83
MNTPQPVRILLSETLISVDARSARLIFAKPNAFQCSPRKPDLTHCSYRIGLGSSGSTRLCRKGDLMNQLAEPDFAGMAESAVICFSHLRWDFVLQRPQHLMGRFATDRRLFFWEEMIPTNHHLPYLEFHAFEGTTVQAIRPRVPGNFDKAATEQALSALLDQLIWLTRCHRPALWFYTPQMWPIARHVEASVIVYDCMDELSGFRFAPPELRENEAALMQAADVVFTGGYSLYEAKRHQHDNIHPFPSSVDAAHFAQARRPQPEPSDQSSLPHPRLGYYGVIDERLDLTLIRDVAAARPDWQIVMLGPIAKIAPEDLPRAQNIHWLGQKSYGDLPAYLSGWDVALMPFAINEATRFISPTKTPEYLAGGGSVRQAGVNLGMAIRGH